MLKRPAEKPAFSWSTMSNKPLKLAIRPQSSRREVADYMNRAFETSDVGTICNAIGDAIRLHNISDIAKKAGIERTSVYRAFGGRQSPNLLTVLSVLDAMGFQLKVTQRREHRARLARARSPDEKGVASQTRSGSPTPKI
jgi:probable addiction module antidote protein